MLRLIVPTLTLLLIVPFGAQAASKQDYELSKMLEKVAAQSSVGTPRAINENILDQGYTVEGRELIDHLSVLESHAVEMRANPDVVRNQLGSSVCNNEGFRQLMAKGALLKYEFTEYKTNRAVATHVFKAADCKMKK
ncbi:quorum-sensing-regulated virulence factor family protein [Pseudomonas sp. 10B1]|uniref:quorum-sensing-regulated virulence factor family protein n=1 Tax=unclassified Pseudomonas TaxID=196821 RepID=UPI002AB57FC3|nr:MULTISPECIES: quorum-sensing-regulated virulence factor family protein [unclassified Pseudomonas]MDY7559381.1 quorum-sensing-regulated virulence factor family protein [Pseudomonas sp. AB6]MEA9978814.1 quorum-sensing-regulated virulence factor family protein [Pseudomonas sp. RTS4]MEA9996601.1 quorum-sensing-regulated virulence factor family protein [Pseudomonas sp. AA4]MEB0087900.1 quorum-sensing-regulated virulence factor family protein [Pseudomonas sp. RTI1]MEB0128157.1 quorum-sensing-regu